MSGFSIKQGVSFQICCLFKGRSGAPVSLEGCLATSQIRDPLSQLLATLDAVQPAGQTGVLNLYYPGSTRNWPAGRYFCDVFLTGTDGVIRATQTFSVTVSPSVTVTGSLPPDGTYNRLDVTVLDAETLLGDGSGLDVTASDKTQTLAEWVASLSGGGNGVGIRSIDAHQGDVTPGQASAVTLTATFTDGTTSETTFEVPAGAEGTGTAGASVDTVTASQSTISAGQSSTVTLTVGLSDGTSREATFDAPPGRSGVGTPGVGVSSVVASQGAVTAGEPSSVTLTVTKTDGTKSEAAFDVPPGSDAAVTSANIEAALGYAPVSPYLKLYSYTDGTPCTITVDMGGGLYGDLNRTSTSWNYWLLPASAPVGWSILVYSGAQDLSIKYADNSSNIAGGGDVGPGNIKRVVNVGTADKPNWICG